MKTLHSKKPPVRDDGSTALSLERGLPSSMEAERSILGSILLDNGRIGQAETLQPAHFSLDSHRRIYSAALELWHEGTDVNDITLGEQLKSRNELEAIGGQAYISSLTVGLPQRLSIDSFVRIVHEKAQLRDIINNANKAIVRALEQEKPSEILGDLSKAIAEIPTWSGKDNWRELFHSFDDFTNAPPLRFAITDFLQEDGVTLIAGPAGDGKTLMMLSMARALLDGTSLFGFSQFSVPTKAERVIYLIPEAAIGPFGHRLKLFHLDRYVQSGKLLVRTLSSKQQMTLADPRFLQAAEGAHVFLDTAIRFMDGDESAAGEAKVFAQTLFNIQSAGAKTITGAHHSPKGFDSAEYMTLENVVRGSGDIGAMLATCWGIKQIDDTTTSIFVQNVKPRDFEPCEPFIIQGRPHIDDHGTFLMKAEPGEAGELKDHIQHKKPGRREDSETPERKERAFKLRSQGMSYRDIARELSVSKSSVEKWLKNSSWGTQCTTH